MADFRKCLLAFAVVALLTSMAVPVAAQTPPGTPALQCTFNAGGTPTVRAEGLTELVGDIVLNCTGGIPTLAGQPVPAANITVFLSTNLTSRITSGSFSEVLMLIDEPHSAANPLVPLTVCDPTGATLGICTITGTGTGAGTYNGSANRPNVFQARNLGSTQPNLVTFFGVPIDPPGSSGTRVVRITNLRGNAQLLGTSSTLVPTQIVANISVTPQSFLPLNNPQQTVAFVQRGLVASVRDPFTFVQCNPANSDIAGDPTKVLQSGGQNAQQFNIRFDEGFASAWKERNIQVHLSNTASGGGPLATGYATPADSAQDVAGANYFSESGFVSNPTTPIGFVPIGYGPGLNASITPFPNVRGLPKAGVADTGTRLSINFGAIPNGTQIFVPTRVTITVPAGASGNVSGFAILTSTDGFGGGTLSPVTGATTSGLAPVTISNAGGMAVYEVMFADPFNIERLTVPIAVAYAANAGNNLPQPNLQSTVTTTFAPLSTNGLASDTAPIPRFAPGPNSGPFSDFIINKCSCNILFPFVTNQQGFDTGVAISNTSVDPFGTIPQAGFVTLNYYSGGTPPPLQKTNATVPGGQQLLFTLSGGGNFGIAAVPGFQGYIIATAEFQYCHAFAYVSAQGALPTAAGASEGYLGIVLDAGGLERTKQTGENKAH